MSYYHSDTEKMIIDYCLLITDYEIPYFRAKITTNGNELARHNS